MHAFVVMALVAAERGLVRRADTAEASLEPDVTVEVHASAPATVHVEVGGAEAAGGAKSFVRKAKPGRAQPEEAEEADGEVAYAEEVDADGDTALEATAHGLAATSPLSPKQAIVCDVCLRKLTSCGRYRPDPRLFDGLRPESRQLGRKTLCDASDQEVWTTDDDFKIADERPECPAERHASKNYGQLSQARGFCEQAVSKKRRLGPRSSCTAVVDGAARVFGRKVHCSAATAYAYLERASATERGPAAPLAPAAPEAEAPGAWPGSSWPATPAPTPEAKPELTPEKPENLGTELTPKQAVVCDMCLRKVTDCSAYDPDPRLFDGTRPAPRKLGRMDICEASPRELWMHDDDFKIRDPRPECPEERQAPKQYGKLGTARRFCEMGRKKQVRDRIRDCTDLVQKAAKVFGRTVTCDAVNAYRYD